MAEIVVIIGEVVNWQMQRRGKLLTSDLIFLPVRVFLTSEAAGCRRTHIRPASGPASRQLWACPRLCSWRLALSPCKPEDGLNSSPFAVYERKSYTNHAREERHRQLKKQRQSTWVLVLGVAPSDGTEMKRKLWICAYKNWGMWCVKFALGHISPSVSQDGRGQDPSILEHLDSIICMVSWAPHLQEKMTILNFKNCIRVNIKGTK